MHIVSHGFIHLGDLPGWVEAGATVAALVVAGYAFVAAKKAYESQQEQLRMQRTALAEQVKINEEQTKVLELQREELRRSLDERVQAQAAMVFTVGAFIDERAAPPDRPTERRCSARITNSSAQPIYDLRFWWHNSTQGEPLLAHAAHVVLPGFTWSHEFYILSGPEVVPGYKVYFRDSGQRHWEMDPLANRRQLTVEEFSKVVQASHLVFDYNLRVQRTDIDGQVI